MLNFQGKASLFLYDFKVDYLVSPQEADLSDLKGFGEISAHEKGRLIIKFDEFSIKASDLRLKLEGIGSDEIQPRFEEALRDFTNVKNGGFNKELLSYLDYLINAKMVSYNQHTPLYNDQMEIDFQLIDQGVRFDQQYLSFVLDGTFHTLEGRMPAEDHTFGSVPLPLWRVDRQPAQIIISDYSINTLLESAEELDWFTMTKQMKAGQLDSYISRFSTAFDVDQSVEILMKPVWGKNNIEFAGSKSGHSRMKFNLQIHVKNPIGNTGMDAALLILEISTIMNLDVSDDFKLIGEVSKIKSEVKHFEAYFRTMTTQKGVEAQIAFLDPFLTSYVNEYLREGIYLPIPSWISQTLKNPRVTAYEGYLVFDSEPIVESNLFLQ